eukprot:CAMPEP_0183743632 /NCGR_PEP_ID=MMETSP0737-20130205/65317_1 /TAXON_ID=385413 /ORGANISM="Thalassiosira miniscula, Strain CCMP1093" /LENGTH=876 /DNA_ID=CAMNT_0025979255 /DNA_START=17 /DNA_END=2645 /DNA_ORIENTATION=+
MAARQQDMWLLVTAHPDDESMFFIPALRNILQNQNKNCGGQLPANNDDDDNNNKIRLLCLSNGDYRDASDGPVRTKEMHDACSLILGIPKHGNATKAATTNSVTVLDDARMKDGPNEVWSPDLISDVVLQHICQRVPSAISIDGTTLLSSKPQHEYMLTDPDKEDEKQSWRLLDKKAAKRVQKQLKRKQQQSTPLCINLNLVTFDEGGVSRHPNHVDTFRGIRYLLNEKCNICTQKYDDKKGLEHMMDPDLISDVVLQHISKKVPSAIISIDGTTLLSSKPKQQQQHDYLLTDPDDEEDEEQSWRLLDKKAAKRLQKQLKRKQQQPKSSSSSNSKVSPMCINLNLLTFDEGGVSRHPNHVDTFRGIRYLLNEKCNICANQDEKEGLEHVAKIWLCPETTNGSWSKATNGSNNNHSNDIIEVNVSVYTLRTISNPLHKYFLWIFVDILPYLLLRGIRYLLNEKCNICTQKYDDKKGLEHMAKLWLCPETTNGSRSKSTNGNNTNNHSNNIIEVNVSVYTLRTISNPLHKYFLWIFVDILPYLLLRLFQTILYLLFFLLGGLLWSPKSAPMIQLFSGMTMSNNAKNAKKMQCQILEPMLVWNAMAAHHSQFVWYRRLSVLFSRYTYINDLRKLSIDAPSEGEEDDSASLPPPLVTIAEEDSMPPFLLTNTQMTALREIILPIGLHHRPWKRIYSLVRDGDSFEGFRKKLEDWNDRLYHSTTPSAGGVVGGGDDRSSTILVVKTTNGELIGGFADGSIVPLALDSVRSASKSCLFKFHSKKEDDNDNDNGDDDGSTMDVYGKQTIPSSSKRIVFDATRRILAFGGGVDDGNGGTTDEGFGLCLNDGFTRGTTARCSAFQNEQLVSEKDGVFAVVDVEVW